jgi:hypothetical protein
MSDAVIMPGSWAYYGGKRWRVGAVGITSGERYYWLQLKRIVMMVPATMVSATAPAKSLPSSPQ